MVSSESKKSETVDNDEAGIGNLLDQLSDPGTCLIAIEATGGYERLLIGNLILNV